MLLYLRLFSPLPAVCQVGLGDQVDDPVCEAELVVEPDDQFHGVFGQLPARLGVHDGRVGVGNEDRAGRVVLGHFHAVAEDGAVGARGGLLDLQAHVPGETMRAINKYTKLQTKVKQDKLL